MLQKISSFLAKQKEDFVRRNAIAKISEFARFRDATHPDCPAEYALKTPDKPFLEALSTVELTGILSQIPKIPGRGERLEQEIKLKLEAQSGIGRGELCYSDNGRPTFRYYRAKERMTESERRLYAYASIGHIYGLYNHLARDQLKWITIRKDCEEWVSELDLRRISLPYALDKDTQELTAVFDFGHKVKDISFAWGVFMAMVDTHRAKHSPADVGARLKAEASSIRARVTFERG